jgi:hypothetical protein
MPTWTITFGTSNVTMPRLPSRIERRRTGNQSTISIPGQDPIIISLGIESESMNVSGILFLTELSLLNALRGFVHKQVSVSGLGGVYDGTYVLSELDWTHEPPDIYNYLIVFTVGSEMITL